MKCSSDKCDKEFEQTKSWRRFCCDRCRRVTRLRLKREAARKLRPPKPKSQDGLPLKRRKLRCHWCSGGHVSTQCPNRKGASVRIFGSVDANGNYIPPPGVKVRMLSLPKTVSGEVLTAILRSDPKMGLKARHRARTAPQSQARR